MPDTTTTWPDGQALIAWLRQSNLSIDAQGFAEELVVTATGLIAERIDTARLPVDGSCPSTVSMAIVLEAARLLSRRESIQGVAAFGDFALRLSTVDVDIEACLRNWQPVLMTPPRPTPAYVSLYT